MKPIVCTKYGSPDVPQLKDHEVFLTVYAASANAADCRLLRGDPPDNRKGCVGHNDATDRFGSVAFV
jgi:hypothetical protein